MKISRSIILVLFFSSFILINCEQTETDKEQFSELKIFEEAIPTDIHFVDDKYGFISGSYEPSVESAVIAKTTDGGLSWTTIPIIIDDTLRPSLLISIYAYNKDIIYTAFNAPGRDNDGICKSVDGGQTWKILSSFNDTPQGFIFLDPMAGFVAIQDNIYRTNDGGKTWSIVYEGTGFAAPYKIMFPDIETGYSYGRYISSTSSYGSIYKTVDKGNSWFILSFHEAVTCLDFQDKNIGYAFTSKKEIYKTLDGGASWIYLNSIPEAGQYFSVVTYGKIKYFASRSIVFKTTDDFKSYSIIYSCLDGNATLSNKAIHEGNSIFILSSHQSIVNIKLLDP